MTKSHTHKKSSKVMAIDSRWGGMGRGAVVPLYLTGKTNKNQEKSTQN